MAFERPHAGSDFSRKARRARRDWSGLPISLRHLPQGHSVIAAFGCQPGASGRVVGADGGDEELARTLVLGGPGRVLRYVWTHPANEGRKWSALGRATAAQARGKLLGRPTMARIGRSLFLAEPGLQSFAAVYGNP